MLVSTALYPEFVFRNVFVAERESCRIALLARRENADIVVLVGRRKATFHGMTKMKIECAVLQFQTLRSECMNTGLIQLLNVLPHDLLLSLTPLKAVVSIDSTPLGCA
jgi:hypothetical protein